jgi:hypothetical protein
MFGNPSLITRIAIGKGIGLVAGLAGFMCLPYFMPEGGLLLRWGILLWYTTFGAIIAIFGVFTWHPILKMPMPWWFRGPFLGGWMNFVLTFFAYDVMQEMMVIMFGPNGFMMENGFMQSPFWFVLEGAILGIIIDYVATKYGGDGPETAAEKFA